MLISSFNTGVDLARQLVTLDSLPSELLTAVARHLSFLDATALGSVSRRLWWAVREASAGRDVDLWGRELGPLQLAAVLAAAAAMRSPRVGLERLDLGECALAEGAAAVVAAHGAGLEWLRVEGEWVHQHTLREMLAGCPRLRSLIAVDTTYVGDEGLRAVALCPDLEEVRITRWGGTDPRALSEVLAACPRLRRLSIDGGCSALTDEALAPLVERGDGCGLRRLEVRGGHRLTDEGVAAALSPDLQQLSVAECCGLTDGLLRRIAELAPPRLASLGLGGAYQVGDAGLLALAAARPPLRTLDISGLTNVTDRGLGALIDACHTLRAIRVRDCASLTHPFLTAVGCRNISVLR